MKRTRARGDLLGLPWGLYVGAAFAAGLLLGCAPDLRLCGDGEVGQGEACDDGNPAAGDGCDAACAVEPGFTCSGAPSVCTGICGDGVAAGGELCDTADLGGNTCESAGFSGGPLACLADCTLDTTGCIPLEACDTGADEDLDGLYDCGDEDCAGVAPCDGEGEVVCDDVADQDSDNFFDCEDPDGCQQLAICAPGQTPTGGPCAAPSDCQATGKDPFCIQAERFEGWREGYCSEFCNLVADDCAGDASCLDTGLPSGNGLCLDGCESPTDCRTGYGCQEFGARKLCFPGAEICDNGIDDDNNGVADCEDAPCVPAAVCAQCGDAVVSEGEQCDDGNQQGGDGCTALCLLEGEAETEPNEHCSQASGLFMPDVVLTGTMGSSDHYDGYAISVPAVADLRIELFTTLSCEVILTFAGQVCEDYVIDTCTELSAITNPSLRGMTPGIYYLWTHWAGGGEDPTPYSIRISYDAICGDGVVEGSEQCDGSADCTPACKFKTTCGDAVVEGDEQCDDGNLSNGDGCTWSCLFETKPESEPNDSCLSSDGPWMPPFLASGSLDPVGEVDYYSIFLTNPADLHIQTFGAGGPGTCDGDTVIQLFSQDLNCSMPLAYNDDIGNDTNVAYCSIIDASQYPEVHDLPAPKLYFVSVSAFPGQSVPSYTLLVTQNTCGDGQKGGLEECDGTANCTPDCQLITDCGDGKVEDEEQCDPPDIVSCSLGCKVILPPENQCADFVDQDNDLLTDCEDPGDCKATPACMSGQTPAGGPCTAPSDCMADNLDPLCISQDIHGYPDGYCSQFCNLEAQNCPEGSTCINWLVLPSGSGVCMQSCTVDTDCRADYVCFNGFCVY